MRNQIRWWLIPLILFAALAARAQTVEFSNGDRLTGKWVSVNGNTITFDSDELGKITFPAGKVKSLSLPGPLVLLAAGGKPISGTKADLAGGTWTIESPNGRQSVAAGQLTEIMPAAAYQATVAHQPLWRGWNGSAAFGFSLERGDQQTHTLSFNFAASRVVMDATGQNPRWRTSYALNTLFASAASGGVQVKSDSLSTTLRQDFFFTPSNFLFALGQADHIQAQNLYLRQAYGGGYGRDLLAGKRANLSVLAGATFENQKFTGVPAAQSAEGLLGEQLAFQISKEVQFANGFNFYPNLSKMGQYRFDTTSALAFKLNGWLNANFGVSDFYVSQIPPGASTTVAPHNNNLAVTAGVGANF